jgi:uncharacterized protein YegL
MTDVKAKIWPAYFVPDESGSMYDYVSVLNRGLTELLDRMQENGLAAALVRLSIIGFSDDVIEHTRLADLRDFETLPLLASHSGTSYASVFLDLRHRIDSDAAQLRSQGFLVLRPAIFFLTDGQPNKENWQSPLRALRGSDFKYRPNIISFGIGKAVPEVIRQVASEDQYAYIAATDINIGTAIMEFFEALTRSLIVTAQSVAEGIDEVVIDPPKGFRLAVDVIE